MTPVSVSPANVNADVATRILLILSFSIILFGRPSSRRAHPHIDNVVSALRSYDKSSGQVNGFFGHVQDDSLHSED